MCAFDQGPNLTIYHGQFVSPNIFFQTTVRVSHESFAYDQESNRKCTFYGVTAIVRLHTNYGEIIQSFNSNDTRLKLSIFHRK